MEAKHKPYDPEARYRPFCMNPIVGNYSVVDTLKEPWHTVTDSKLSRAQADDEADRLNRKNPEKVRRERTRKARAM